MEIGLEVPPSCFECCSITKFFLLPVYNIMFWFALQTNVDKDQVKAAIKAQQDQQIDNVRILILLQICTIFCMVD